MSWDWRALSWVAFALLAGCTTPEVVTQDATEEVLVDPNRPAPSYGDVVTGPAVGPDLNATTAAAPRLVAGEWWRIRFENGPQDELVRVVAQAGDDGYVLGMPHGGWYKEAIAYHAPAFGDVHLDLSYNTHNALFQPLRFPLEPGDTWETEFATSPYIATVEAVDEFTATISFVPPPSDPSPTDPITDLLGLTGDGGEMRMVYDARMHEVVRMESVLGVWEVIAHGYDFEGWVTVPRGEHTAIDYGTFGPAEPGQPLFSRTVDVEGGFNRLTMMHLLVGITPGSYRIRSVAPNGTEFQTETTGMADFLIRFYEARDPDGTWTQEDFVIGVGATYSMGIAYHQYDIHLPDGQRRADHSHPVIR